MLKYSLGLDVSQKDLHACLSCIDAGQQVKAKASHRFANQAQGFKDLVNWLARHKKQAEVPLTITMEATGVYYEAAALFLFKAGYELAVVLPGKAKKYHQALGLKTKNDKVDAWGLSRMGAEQHLEPWQPMGEFFYTLRALTRHHQALQELKTNIGNQLHADEHSIYQNKTVIKQLKKLIDTIDKELLEVTAEIDKQLCSTPQVAQKVAFITQIKGVGTLTAATVLAETNGFALFGSASQLVSYAGYDVVENQSGSHKGKTRISKKGNSHLRRCLHLPALNVVRYQVGHFGHFFERLLERHHCKMKAYVAVQKKLLVLIYTLWKKNEPFRPPAAPGESSREVEAAPSFAPAEGQLNEVAPA